MLQVIRTNAVDAAGNEEKSNHYGSTEDQISDLLRAADLSAYVLESTLDDQKVDPALANGHPNLVAISEKRHEMLMFAAYQVIDRTRALKSHLGYSE